jgi:hypothetical protein
MNISKCLNVVLHCNILLETGMLLERENWVQQDSVNPQVKLNSVTLWAGVGNAHLNVCMM